LRASLKGPAWHGPSLLEILQDVSAEEAQTRPIPSAHTIAELVAHIAAWNRAAERGLDSQIVTLQGEADWPEIGEWSAAVAELEAAVTSLASRAEATTEDELKQKVRSADSEYSRYVLFHGVTQHNLYHAGQLAVLKKALRASLGASG